MWFYSSSTTASIAKAKRAERDAELASAEEFVPGEHQVFLNASAGEIVKRIGAGEWTASRVLEAYIARTAQAQAKTNCITEVLFEETRKDAELLDKEFAATGKIKGPLHGVPVSIKDMFNIKGVDTTIGFSRYAHQPANEDAPLVHQLRAAGAIPFVKTNVPQTMLAFECANPVWGVSTNPHSDAHTCGGSSGGEAALLAMDGSALGFGSDIGGSLRIPASYCGVYSLKPGFGRITHEGIRDPNCGEAIHSVTGPMGRSVDDIEIASRLLFGQEDVSYFPAPIPYREVELPEKLTFGYYTYDGFIKTSPACERAVLETVEALRRKGHKCIEFTIPDILTCLHIFVGLASADGFKTLLSHLGPDPVESSLFLTTLGPRLPGFLRWLSKWVANSVVGDQIFASMFDHSRTKSVKEYFEYVAKRDEYKHSWIKEVWGKYGFDGIIAPVQASPALPHGGCTALSCLAVSTFLYNVVDSPVGIIPVTRVDPKLDQITDKWRNDPGHGSQIWENELYGKGLYDAEKMKGLPVAVQVVGKKWEEEKVIAMMHVVDKALGPRGFGPGCWKQ